MKILTILWICILSVTCDQDGNNDIIEVKCGQSSKLFDECFKDMSPSVAEFLSSVKIPISMDEINARCMIFNKGMKCVDNYIEKCIDIQQRKIIDNEVHGAKQLFDILCENKNFQREFLRHKECFYHIQKDWDVCSTEFVNILKEEMAKSRYEKNSNIQYMQFCCARYGYETCVYNSARYKCKPDSAIFIKNIAKILSAEKQFTNCDKIEKDICSSTSKLVCNLNIFYLLVIFILVLILNNN